MAIPMMFSDIATIEERIALGNLTSLDAQQALNDLDVLYRQGKVSGEKKRELEIKLYALL